MNTGFLTDVFLGNDEIDLALLRLDFLQEYVDFTLIGEASHLFSGARKDPVFKRAQRDGRFPANVDVVDIQVPRNVRESGDRWTIETFCRETLLQTAAQRYPQGLLIFSDLDEIPSREQCRRLPRSLARRSAVAIPMRTYVRRLDLVEEPLFRLVLKAKAVRADSVVKRLRYRIATPVFGAPGYHLTYLGMNAGGIAKKHASFSHVELDIPMYQDARLMQLCNSYQVDHRGRFWRLGNGLLRRIDERKWNELQHLAARRFSGSALGANKLPGFSDRLALSLYLAEVIGGKSHENNFFDRGFLNDGSWSSPLRKGKVLSLWLLQMSGVPFILRVVRRLLAGDKREGFKGLSGWFSTRRGIGGHKGARSGLGGVDGSKY